MSPTPEALAQSLGRVLTALRHEESSYDPERSPSDAAVTADLLFSEAARLAVQ